jgi:hypothetical protein
MIRPEARLENCDCAAHQWFGFGEAVRGLKQKREIVEAVRHIGVIRAAARRADRQRAAHQWFGFGEAFCGPKQDREIVKADRHTWMIRAVALLVDRKARVDKAAPLRRGGSCP